MALELVPRSKWRNIPDGFHSKDIETWRFRRQLSVLRRPLIRLDNSENPTYLLAPGLIRDGFGYTVRGYYEGSFPVWHYRSNAMRKWCGDRTVSRGAEFTALVADRIKAMGWRVEKTELKISEILGYRKDPEYGDVSKFGDVDVLAWNKEKSECSLSSANICIFTRRWAR